MKNNIPKKIVAAIINELTDRVGLRQAIEDIDRDTYEELQEELERIVDTILTKAQRNKKHGRSN